MGGNRGNSCNSGCDSNQKQLNIIAEVALEYFQKFIRTGIKPPLHLAKKIEGLFELKHLSEQQSNKLVYLENQVEKLTEENQLHKKEIEKLQKENKILKEKTTIFSSYEELSEKKEQEKTEINRRFNELKKGIENNNYISEKSNSVEKDILTWSDKSE